MKHRCSFFYLFMLCGGMTVHLQASPYQGEPVCKMAIGNEQQPKLEDLRTLRNKYPLPIPKATQAEILSAQAAVDSYQLQRIDEKTVTDVTGLSHDAMTYQQNREVAKNVRALAAVAYNGGQAEKKTFELYLDYILSQGFVQMVAGPGFYEDWRNTPANFLSALSVCDDVRAQRMIDAVAALLNKENRMYDDWGELKKHINSDFIYMMLPHLFLSALYTPSEEGAVKKMEQFSNYISGCTRYVPGGGNILKPDGVGFHHGAHYNGYMYSYNTWVEYMYRLAGTSYHVTKDAFQRMQKAVMTPYLMATASTSDKAHFYGNSMAGRHPFTGMEVNFSRKLIEQLITIGEDMNNEEEEKELQAFYNYIFKTEKYPDIPKKNFDGFYQFNYSPAGVYRQNNWVAVMRAPTSRFWGAEIYNKTNRLGRYQGHGTLEILYEGKNLGATGYPTNQNKKGAGWDWNVMPGTTTVHYTSWEDMMPNKNEKDRFDQYAVNSNFSGALSWGDCGIWASAFDQGDCWGNPQRFEATNLHFCKSVFAIDGMLFGLGTGISAKGNYPDEWITATNLFQSVQSSQPGQLYINGKEIGPGNEQMFRSKDAVWMVTPNTTGYYIPAGHDNLIVRYGEQESPSSEGLSGKMGKELVAKAYLNHGVKPSGKQYCFVVIPATTPDKMGILAEQLKKNKIFNVISQQDSVHIVKHLPTNTLAYALFAPVSGLDAGYITESDTELLVMERSDKQTKELKLALCNPDLRPQTLDKGWMETPTQVVLKLKGNWKVVSSSQQSDLRVEKSSNSETVLKVTLKEGAPLYISLKDSLSKK